MLVLKTKMQFRILLLSVLLFAGTGCSIFHRSSGPNGQLISTKPHGRLALGEIDNMSGTKNENQNEPVQENKHRRH